MSDVNVQKSPKYNNSVIIYSYGSSSSTEQKRKNFLYSYNEQALNEPA